MRVPVVDVRGIPLMPCTPPKARALLKAGKARPKRNKLGLFYIQLTYAQDPSNQPLVVGIDPGSKFEGFSVVGKQDTVCNLMVEAPDHVKGVVETRRTMRRARRFRLWRRPCRSQNRSRGMRWVPPSTRSRWEAKARIVRYLLRMLPLTDASVEDVQAETRPGKGGKWNSAFSPVQVGKEDLYRLLKLCTIGGYDRTKQRISLHAYRTNKRLTQRAKPSECHRLTTLSFRSWLIASKTSQKRRAGTVSRSATAHSSPA